MLIDIRLNYISLSDVLL